MRDVFSKGRFLIGPLKVIILESLLFGCHKSYLFLGASHRDGWSDCYDSFVNSCPRGSNDSIVMTAIIGANFIGTPYKSLENFAISKASDHPTQSRVVPAEKPH